MLSVDPLSHDVLFKMFEFLEACAIDGVRFFSLIICGENSFREIQKYAFLRNDWFVSFAFLDCFLDENRLKTVLDGKKLRQKS